MAAPACRCDGKAPPRSTAPRSRASLPQSRVVPFELGERVEHFLFLIRQHGWVYLQTADVHARVPLRVVLEVLDVDDRDFDVRQVVSDGAGRGIGVEYR